VGFRGAIVGLGVLVVGVAAAAAAGLAGAGGWWALSAASAGGVAGAFVPSLVSAVLDARRHRIETRAALEAASARVEASPELSPAKLLSPDRGVVAFRGRERELAELRVWCLGEGRPVRALVGAGGIGKTRLVRQLAADLAAQGWQCRFVRQDHEAQIVDLTVAGAREPLLLVVDYAETAVGLAHMLEAVVRVPERVRLRVLLVARGIGEWWDRLESATFQAPSLLAPPLVLAPGLGEGVELEQVVQDALRDFGRVLGLTPPRAEIVLNQAAPPVLVVHAAALVALLGARDTAREPVRVRVETGVLGELLRHEAVYWRRSAEPAGLAELDATTRRRVVAVACVADAPDEAGAASLLEAVPDLRGSPEAVRRKTARWLRQLYTPASPQTWFGSLQPDLLAERHVVEQFTASPDLADACVAGMAGERARRPLTVLARAMDHDDRALAVTGRLITLHPGLVAPAIEVAIGAGERLAGLLTSVLPGLAMPPEAVDRADAALPGSTVLLAEVAVLLARRMLEEVPLDTDPRTPVWRRQHLALRLAQVGRSAQALPYNEQAVAICRELVEDDPERFTPVLAAAVNDLSVRLYEVGRTADALPYAEEAVRLLRASVEHDQELRPALAAALLNLGVWLWRTERASDAVPYTGEAVLLYEDLMHTAGGRFLPDWAAALDNLGVQLHAVGQLEEAVRRTTLAVAMRLQLAEAAPDQYEPDAARTLTNAGMILRDAGRTEEARGALRRGVTMLRDLEQRHPGRFQVPLLRALNGLLQVGVVGAEERSAAREVLVLSAEQLPPERRPVTELMIRQADLDEEAVRHEQAQRRREAVYCLTDALAVGRQIARLEPQVHDADLAQRLNRLGHELIGFDDLPGALCYFEEAVSLQRRVVARDPATPLEPLAHYLRNLGQWRLAANQERDAIPTLEGAVLTHEVLAHADARHERNLALVLGDLMAALALTGDFAQAVPYGQRALEIWERQARTDPNGSHDRLLSCLINLATCHEALGDPASADHYTQRANTVQHPRRPLDRREDE
jgi:tetratricopeptide (TPR) repeat protein